MTSINSISKKICFLYADINGSHSTNDNVSTKNLYNFARLIALNYSIGMYVNGIYHEIKYYRKIIKPDTIVFNKDALKNHNITMEKAINEGILNTIVISELKEDLKDVQVIISHNTSLQLKSIQVECFRSAINIDFSKFILIDTKTFGNSNIILENISKLENIIPIFIKLYENQLVKI